MPVLTIRLPTELHERFLAECEKREIKPSEFGRRAIEAIVDRMGDEPATRSFVIPAGSSVSVVIPKRLPPQVRGFAIDGSPIVSKTDRLKSK